LLSFGTPFDGGPVFLDLGNYGLMLLFGVFERGFRFLQGCRRRSRALAAAASSLCAASPSVAVPVRMQALLCAPVVRRF
jgi:hypothetical protein